VKYRVSTIRDSQRSAGRRLRMHSAPALPALTVLVSAFLYGGCAMEGEAADQGDEVATTAALSSPPGEAPFCNEIRSLTSYALYTNGYADIGRYAKVEDGNVGVRAAASTLPGDMEAALHLRANATFTPTFAAVSKSAFLAAGSSLGTLYATNKNGPGTIVPPKLPFPGTPNMPTIPGVGVVNYDASRNITVGMNGSQELELNDPDRNYGIIILRENATLTLAKPGTYNFFSIAMGKNAKILTQGKVIIKVQASIRLGEGAQIRPDEGFDQLTAKDLQVLTPLNTVTNPNDGSSAVVRFGQSAFLHGLLIAPAGSVEMLPGSNVLGAIAADRFTSTSSQARRVIITYEDGIYDGSCTELCESYTTNIGIPALRGEISYLSNEPLVEGTYFVHYEAGCMMYNYTQWWAVNAHNTKWAWFLVGEDPMAAPELMPGTEGFWPDTMPLPPDTKYGFKTFAQCEAANKALPGKYYEHLGGKLGVKLKDFPVDDNLPGTPNPTWSVTRTAEYGMCDL
jgi:hypothetical protein